MLISYQWLRELSGTALTPAELRDRLTMVGLAIDAVESKETDSVLDVEVPSNRPDCLKACPLTLAGVAGWPSTQQSKGRA